jgi:hypothetical protein
MSEINYFKVLLLYKIMWQMMLDRCRRVMTELDIGVNILHIKIINLNDHQ